MTTSTVEDALSATWWPELLSVKDTLSWAALSQKFGASANTLRSALAASGQAKAPMAPGRKPKGASAASESPAVTPARKPAAAPKVASPLDKVRAQVGKAPDAEVAALAGVSADEVKEYRRRHDIAAFRQAPPTRAAKAPAQAAAPPRARSREGDQVVRRRRAKDGGEVEEVLVRTPAPEPVAPPPAVEVPNPLEAFRDQLGKVSDGAIATLAGVDRAVVGAWRRTLGVPAYDGFRQRKPAVVEAVPDAVVAGEAAPAAPASRSRKPGKSSGKPTRVTSAASKAPVATNPAPAAASAATDDTGSSDTKDKGRPGRRSAIDSYASLLGTVTDAEVAAKANVTVAAVTQYRIRRGIPAANRKPAATPSAPVAPAGIRHRRSKLDAHAHLVGKLSDAEVALLADVTSEGVRQYRRRHGIPSAATGGARDVVAPVVAAAQVAAPVAPAATLLVAEAAPEAPVAPAAAPVPAAPEAPAVVAAPKAVAKAVAKAAQPAAAPSLAYGVVALRGAEVRRFVSVGADIRAALELAAAALDARTDGPWVIRSVRELCEALA